MKKYYTPVAFGLLMLFAFSQPRMNPGNLSEPEKNTSLHTITVTGSADMSIVPDNMDLIIQLTEYEKGSGKDGSMENLQKELDKKLADAGVEKGRIAVNTGITYWRYYWDWYYYQNSFVSKSVSVKITSMDQLDKVITSLRMRGITNVYLGETSHKDVSEYRKQVKIQAIKAAKEKAGYLLETIGEKVGNVISINEIANDNNTTHTWEREGYYPYYPYNYYPWWGGGYYSSGTYQNSNNSMSNSSMNAGNMSAPNGNGMQNAEPEDNGLKKIKLRYEVEAVFEIAGK